MNLSTLLGSRRKKAFAATAVRPARRAPRLHVQNLESREVPASLPPAVIGPTSYTVVGDQSVRDGANVLDFGTGPNGAGGAFAPVIATDPTNAMNLIEANVIYTDAGRSNTQIGLFYSTDGGASWNLFAAPAPEADYKDSTTTLVEFTNVSNPSVAFDSFGNVYCTYAEYNTDQSCGRVVLRKYSFASTQETNIGNGSANLTSGFYASGLEHVLYKWSDSDPAYTPVVAVDNNKATFSDVNSLGNTVTQSDPLAAAETAANKVRVFVAWTMNDVAPTNTTINPNVIRMAMSSDGGTTFGAPVLVNDTGNFPGVTYAQPQIAFTQGRVGETGAGATSPGNYQSGGRMVTLFNDFTNQAILSDSTAFKSTTVPYSVEVSNNSQMTINDAIAGSNGSPDSPRKTDYNLVVGAIPAGMTKISNISVSLNIHTDDLKDLSAQLIAPNGTAYTLFAEATDNTGTSTGFGLAGGGTDLGFVNGFAVSTVFQDHAPRLIVDPNATGSRTGTYQPEQNEFSTMNGTFAAVPTAKLTGTWKIEIVDWKSGGTPPPTEYIQGATLKFEQNMTDGLSGDNDTGSTPVKGTFTGTNFPTASAASPVGIGPGVAVAVDNTLGAYSPYENRVYMAYVENNSQLVSVKFSDDGGVTWSALPTQPSTGFLPALAVDPTTGTMGLSYYSTTWAANGAPVTGDAAGARSATMFTTSINGPAFSLPGVTPLGSLEFNTPQFVNPPERYQNQITSQTLQFEPIPSNGKGMGGEGFGNNMGLNIYQGRVNLLYGGNFDANGAFIRTQQMTIADGPRVVQSDSGPVLAGATTKSDFPVGTGATITYNNTFASDGHRQFDGFVVTFDRPVDPTGVASASPVPGFDPSDVKVIFRSPTDDPVNGGTVLPTTDYSIVALDHITDPTSGNGAANQNWYGSERFLIKLNTPQSAIGTYSYSIGPKVADRVRSTYYSYVDNNAATQTFTKTYSAPGLAIPDAINITPGTVTSKQAVNIAGNPPFGRATVQVDITHADVSELRLVLISPTGVRIPLANAGDSGSGANFTGTIFDDAGQLTLADDLPPHSDPRHYKPDQRIGQLRGSAVNGNWALEVTDLVAGNNGYLNDWKLNLTPATLVKTTSNGNSMDQNQDGVTAEAVQDVYAVPNPVNGTPFQLPYTSGSLPVVISGPYVVATRMAGNPATSDNIVVNSTAGSIDVQFDRTINTATFDASDIIRMTGPLGEIPLSSVTVVPITGLNGTPLPDPTTNSQYYRISFPTQQLSGYYQVQLSANIKDTLGNAIDTNHNAGVGNLNGAAVGSPTDLRVYDAGSLNIAVPANVTTTIPLTINEGYQLSHARATISLVLNGSTPTANIRNLDIRLIAPDGTTVLLATNAPQNGAANSMINTTFDDAATTPVQLGGTFDNASFNPIQPLAQLNGHASNGVWKLVIKNKGAVAGTFSKFALTFDKPRVGTGLGEPIADQTSLSFHIFTANGSNPVARSNWTPIGPAGEGTDNTAGRVEAVAVDPTDPSGNTVYAAGVSGGVWRTTNFLTNDVDGPTWVPLTDFGPQNAINVGAITLYPDPNGDPQKTTILVGTGSEDANRIQTQEMQGLQDLRFDGVGFLLSEDAGKTWQVLDSLDNFDSTTGQYRPIVDPGPTFTVATTTENGGTVTVTTSQPNGFAAGTPVQISGNSVAGYNGTFTILQVLSPTQFTYTDQTTGLANGSGGTAQVLDRRDHRFVGAVVNKLVYEQAVNPFTGRPIAYAVVGQGTTPAANKVAGLYRSLDGGRTWKQLYQGTVDDFQVVQGSQLPNSGNRPTLAYMTVEGDGMYRTVNLNSSIPAFTQMLGKNGRPTINSDLGGTPATDPANDPNGSKGKIVLAVPAQVAGDPLANNYYQRWVYALVSKADGTMDGYYLSKDAGDNWTEILTPPPVPPDSNKPFFSNFGGNHSLAVAVDPTNPNISYIGSDALYRVDATFANDPYNLSLYQYHNADGGAFRNLTQGGVAAKDTTKDDGVANNGEYQSGLDAYDPNNIDPLTFGPTESFAPLTYFDTGEGGLDTELQTDPLLRYNFINLVRDPYNPFRTDTALDTQDTFPGPNTVDHFTNNGNNTNVQASIVERIKTPLGPVDNPKATLVYDWIANLQTYVDPLTGQGRVVFGSDQGIDTFVGGADGSLTEVNTFHQPGVNLQYGLNQQAAAGAAETNDSNLEIYGRRNGNLQLARLYSGDVQPSLLAASIAQSLAVAASRRLPDAPASTPDVISTGDTQWAGVGGRTGRANAVAVDKTGTGAIYILRRVNESENPPLLPPVPANFFQVSLNGNPPISRTNGLFDRGFKQWTNGDYVFAVNPIDPLGVIMGSTSGNLYRTTDQGLNWFNIGDGEKLSGQGVLDGSYTTAMAFGAPRTDATSLDDYIYAGTKQGKIFVTITGGGTNAGGQVNWTDISAGLDGSEIQKIEANPARGSNEAYAITSKGVYWMQDWTAPGAQWVNITTNLTSIQSLGFGNNNWASNLVGLGNQTPQLLSMAVDWRPTYAPVPGVPVLYVGGDAGVFKTTRNATDPTKTTWARFTNQLNNNSASDGGGLPVVKVMSLDLATGNIDPNTGRVNPTAAPALLVATTLGRGTWSIALGSAQGVGGPKIVSSSPTTPQTTPVSKVTVTFDQYIDPTSFDPSDVTVTDPNGNPVTVAQVNDVTPAPLPGQPNLHNVYDIVFDADPTTPGLQKLTADGQYTIVVGPNITDGAGNKMDQNGNGNPGETTDAYTMKVVIGRNDVTDFVDDTFTKLLGRLPSTAEYTGAANLPAGTNVFGKDIPNVVNTRYTALQTVLKDPATGLLTTYNNAEARTKLVERLFDNGNTPNEIGNLLPAASGYVLTAAERDTLVNNLKTGKMSPESIVVYILSKPEYYTYTGGTPAAFLSKLYTDLFKGTTVTFASLPATTQSAQLSQASTASGRVSLIKSLVGGATVKYDNDGNPATPLVSTNYRLNLVSLIYQQLLGRPATAAEQSAGKTLMAKPLANGSLQGSEWVEWKVLSSAEYFSLNKNAQSDGLPDDGLHTDRAWVEGVIRDEFYRNPVAGKYSTAAERDTYSQKILDVAAFKTARLTLVKAIVGSTEFKTDQVTHFYQLAYGPTRIVSSTEMTNALNALKNGGTYNSLLAKLLGSDEFYNANTNPTHTPAQRAKEWADAVYLHLYGAPAASAAEETFLTNGLSNTATGRATAATKVLNATSPIDPATHNYTWRDVLIKQAFSLLGVGATTPGTPNAAELLAYETFLKTQRWESLFADIIVANTAINDTPTLARQYWEIDN